MMEAEALDAAGVKGMKWHQHLAQQYGYKSRGKDALGRSVYVHKDSQRGGEGNSFSVDSDGTWNHDSRRFSGNRPEPSRYTTFGRGKGELEALLQKRHGTKKLDAEADDLSASKRFHLDELMPKFKAACAAGWKCPQGMEATAPEGWEGTVKRMEDNHPEIDNPYALTHWMKDQGYKPHYEKVGGNVRLKKAYK